MGGREFALGRRAVDTLEDVKTVLTGVTGTSTAATVTGTQVVRAHTIWEKKVDGSDVWEFDREEKGHHISDIEWRLQKDGNTWRIKEELITRQEFEDVK